MSLLRDRLMVRHSLCRRCTKVRFLVFEPSAIIFLFMSKPLIALSLVTLLSLSLAGPTTTFAQSATTQSSSSTSSSLVSSSSSIASSSSSSATSSTTSSSNPSSSSAVSSSTTSSTTSSSTATPTAPIIGNGIVIVVIANSGSSVVPSPSPTATINITSTPVNSESSVTQGTLGGSNVSVTYSRISDAKGSTIRTGGN